MTATVGCQMPESQTMPDDGFYVEKGHMTTLKVDLWGENIWCNKLLSATSEITHILHSEDLDLFTKPLICVYSFRILLFVHIGKISEKQLILLYIKYDKWHLLLRFQS